MKVLPLLPPFDHKGVHKGGIVLQKLSGGLLLLRLGLELDFLPDHEVKGVQDLRERLGRHAAVPQNLQFLRADHL